MKIKLTELPSPLSIVALYNEVATKAGFNPNNCTYDCTKINVSTDIMEAIEEGGVYGKGENFAMVWVAFGPKEDKELEELTVDIQAGFVKTREKEEQKTDKDWQLEECLNGRR